MRFLVDQKLDKNLNNRKYYRILMFNYKNFYLLVSGLLIVHIQFLNDSSCVLHNLWVGGSGSLGEWLDDRSDHHLLELFSTFLIDAQISNGEKSDSSRRLRRSFVVSHNLKELLQSPMLDQVSAKCV